MSAVLACGTVMQTSCSFNEFAASVTAGLTTSIVNQYISKVYDDYFGVGGGFSFSQLR
jgi:hypothetical protein